MQLEPVTSIDGVRRRLDMARDDRRRAELLCDYLPSLVASDPEGAITLSEELAAIAAASGSRLQDAIAHRYKGEALLSVRNSADAESELRTAYELFRQLLGGPSSELARPAAASVAITLGDIDAERERPADALRWYLTALDAAAAADVRSRVRAHDALGHLYAGLGEYALALEHQFNCLSLLERYDTDADIGVVLSAIGTSYALWGDREQANAYLSRALDHFRFTGNRLREVQTLGNLSLLLFEGGDLAGALELALTAGTIYEALDDRVHAAGSLVTVGNIYERQGSLDAALHCYLRALHTVESADNHTLHANVLFHLGNLYRITGALGDAQFVHEQALGIIQELEEPRLQAALHESLAQVYEELDLPSQALEHHKIFARLRDHLAGMERQKAVAELQIRFDLESAARERELFRMRAEQLEAEMERKQSELTALALNLVQKNELLDSLRQQIAALKGESGNGAGSVDRILTEIEVQRDPGRDWEILEKQMQARNPELVQRLLERCPTLTKAELKVCCLTSINLPTKDIATLLFTSTRTVEAHRLNVRRKLDLPPRGNLAAFLSSL